MSDINEAYSVLSDPIKRAQYDSTYSSKSFNTDSNNNEEDVLEKSLEGEWKKIITYYPDLDEITNDLKKISTSLVYAYKIKLLESRNFHIRLEIANSIERQFLEKYFGKNKEIIKFAKELIILNLRSAAKELNEAVNLFGDNIEPEVVIKLIKNKYGFETKSEGYSAAKNYHAGPDQRFNEFHSKKEYQCNNCVYFGRLVKKRTNNAGKILLNIMASIVLGVLASLFIEESVGATRINSSSENNVFLIFLFCTGIACYLIFKIFPIKNKYNCPACGNAGTVNEA